MLACRSKQNLLLLFVWLGCSGKNAIVEPTPAAHVATLDCSKRHSDMENMVVIPNGARKSAAGMLSKASYPLNSPLEACTIQHSREELMELRCNDGKPAYETVRQVAESRLGSRNRSPQGRCNNIIDIYVVPCSEAKYRVFVDPYICEEKDADFYIERWKRIIRNSVGV